MKYPLLASLSLLFVTGCAGFSVETQTVDVVPNKINVVKIESGVGIEGGPVVKDHLVFVPTEKGMHLAHTSTHAEVGTVQSTLPAVVGAAAQVASSGILAGAQRDSAETYADGNVRAAEIYTDGQKGVAQIQADALAAEGAAGRETALELARYQHFSARELQDVQNAAILEQLQNAPHGDIVQWFVDNNAVADVDSLLTNENNSTLKQVDGSK